MALALRWVFCTDIRIDSDFCFIHHWLIGFYNRGGKCLLRGTEWFLKYSRLRFVFKRLIYVMREDIAAGIMLLWTGHRMDDPRFNPLQGQEVLFSKTSRQALWTTEPPIQFLRRFLPRECSGPCEKLATQLHPVPRLRMSGAVPLPSRYSFLACTETNLSNSVGLPNIVRDLITHLNAKNTFSNHEQQSAERFLYILLIKRSLFRIRHRTECVHPVKGTKEGAGTLWFGKLLRCWAFIKCWYLQKPADYDADHRHCSGPLPLGQQPYSLPRTWPLPLILNPQFWLHSKGQSRFLKTVQSWAQHLEHQTFYIIHILKFDKHKFTSSRYV